MILISILIISLFGQGPSTTASTSLSVTEKIYIKEYYNNGSLKAEGWEINKMKTDYWYFYFQNGKIERKGSYHSDKKDGYWYFYNSEGVVIKEGHYLQNSTEDWWIFYDIDKDETRKIQFKNNKRNGIGLYYKSNKLLKAVKYVDNEQTGEWTSISSFRRDNPNISFR
jgi:antitoxin component YwqK of YwqJK toxin-antitoxin module